MSILNETKNVPQKGDVVVSSAVSPDYEGSRYGTCTLVFASGKIVQYSTIHDEKAECYKVPVSNTVL